MPFSGFEGARNFDELGRQIQAAVACEVTFDRFNVGLLDLDAYEFIDAYVYGRNVPGRQTGHRRTLEGTVVEAALGSGGVYAGSDDAIISRRFRFTSGTWTFRKNDLEIIIEDSLPEERN